jgi:hypothetical protein
VNQTLDDQITEAAPAFWYGLPHGYRPLDIRPSPDGLAEAARRIRELPAEFRDRADQVFRLYAAVALMLQRQRVQGWAMGLHPDHRGDPSLSVLTVSSVPMPGTNPKRVLAMMLNTGAGNGIGEGVRAVELPAGSGFLTESVRRTTAPGRPPEGEAGPRQGTVWQGTVAIPDVRSSSVIAIQMVTASVDLADDYRRVLLGTAATVSFTDPAASDERGSEPPADPAADARSPFG